MKNSTGIILGISISIITILLGIIIAAYNTEISWVVCDDYSDHKECYKVYVKIGDYLTGNNKERYEEV